MQGKGNPAYALQRNEDSDQRDASDAGTGNVLRTGRGGGKTDAAGIFQAGTDSPDIPQNFEGGAHDRRSGRGSAYFGTAFKRSGGLPLAG